jgi:hypothetical protein
MEIRPSNSTMWNDRRSLFGWELTFGGSGQKPLSGTAFNVPDTNYTIYAISFTTASIVSAVQFDTNYAANSAQYRQISFPAGYVWFAPIKGVQLTSGAAIAYQFSPFDTNLCT